MRKSVSASISSFIFVWFLHMVSVFKETNRIFREFWKLSKFSKASWRRQKSFGGKPRQNLANIRPICSAYLFFPSVSRSNLHRLGWLPSSLHLFLLTQRQLMFYSSGLFAPVRENLNHGCRFFSSNSLSQTNFIGYPKPAGYTFMDPRRMKPHQVSVISDKNASWSIRYVLSWCVKSRRGTTSLFVADYFLWHLVSVLLAHVPTRSTCPCFCVKIAAIPINDTAIGRVFSSQFPG